MSEKPPIKKIGKKFWQDLWKLLVPFKSKMTGLFIAIALFEIFKLASPYIFKLVIEKIENFDPNQIWNIVGLIFLMLFADSFSSLIHFFKDSRIFDFLISIEYKLPILLQKKLVALSLGYHEKENTGNKITKIQRGVDKLVDLLANFAWEFWPTIANIIFTFILLFYFNWQVSLTFFVFIPIYIFITIRMNQIINPMRVNRHEEYENASGILGQSIINIYTVQSFAQEKRETKKFKTIRRRINEIEKKEFGTFLRYNLLRSFIIDLGRASVTLLSVYFAWQGTISIGSLVFFITLSEMAYHALFRISRTYDRLIESSTAVERITNLLNEEPRIENKPKLKKNTPITGEVNFSNVHFYYNSKDKNPALKNINMKIEAGQTVALVGPSGGGKSTMIKLIYRHYDVTKGKITLGDHNIKDYDLPSYRSQLAIVPQDVEIFNTSLKENITYAKNNATDKEIRRAIKAANIDFVNKLDNGLDTLVGERGIRLSGGQKQRVGIARAVLAKPKILIFDEATSSLDTHSERLIQKAIEKLAKKQTMIIIAHRLSTVINADSIFVVDKGEIAEAGTHEELLSNKDGIYTHLLKLQAIGELK